MLYTLIEMHQHAVKEKVGGKKQYLKNHIHSENHKKSIFISKYCGNISKNILYIWHKIIAID